MALRIKEYAEYLLMEAVDRYNSIELSEKNVWRIGGVGIGLLAVGITILIIVNS